jgi:lipoprotein signal peptidase
MWYFLSAACAVDIIVKIAARTAPVTVGYFSFTTPFGMVGLVPSVNDVLAFSLPIPNVWIWPVGLVVVALLFRVHTRSPDIRERRAIFAIILGAVSNLIDRVFLGGVTDYLSFSDVFPAFNIADLLIIGGIIGWIRVERTRESTVRC